MVARSKLIDVLQVQQTLDCVANEPRGLFCYVVDVLGLFLVPLKFRLLFFALWLIVIIVTVVAILLVRKQFVDIPREYGTINACCKQALLALNVRHTLLSRWDIQSLL